jgi:hypothetical protein
MIGAEGSVRTGIAEIEGELSRLHLNRQGVGRRRAEIDVRPRLHAENAPAPALRFPPAGRPPITMALAPPGKFLIFSPGLGVGEFPDKHAKIICEARRRCPPRPWSPTSARRSAHHESRCLPASTRCAAGWESRKLIAITIIVTARSFAICPRVRVSFVWSCCSYKFGCCPRRTGKQLLSCGITSRFGERHSCQVGVTLLLAAKSYRKIEWRSTRLSEYRRPSPVE